MDLFVLVLCLSFLLCASGQYAYTSVCRDGEEFRSCASHACEGSCASGPFRGRCRGPCSPGCFCTDGFLRNSAGRCVERKDCGRRYECGPDEEYLDCGSSCPETCSNQYEDRLCPAMCLSGCFCMQGTVRAPDGRCVPPSRCPIEPCGENEVVSNCVNPCNSCDFRFDCMSLPCRRGCDCRPGFLRNSTGQCVQQHLCRPQMPVCPINEEYVQCVITCNDCFTRGNCAQFRCEAGCDCIAGHYRNEQGVCVPEIECFRPSCGVNEEYTNCIVPCNDCETKGNCQYSCNPGCDCKRGHYRNQRGICVPVQSCPTRPSCGVNEEYTNCVVPCNDCETRGNCQYPCNPGCDCKTGHHRNQRGICVPARSCPTRCGPDEEFYECVPSCTRRCERLSNVTCPLTCRPGCFCRRGLVMRADWRCVTPDRCRPTTYPPVVPPPLRCGRDEEPYECAPFCTGTCAAFTRPGLVCPAICIRSCFCRRGLLKRRDGKCVPPSQCRTTPSRGGGDDDDEEFNSTTISTPVVTTGKPGTSTTPKPPTKLTTAKSTSTTPTAKSTSTAQSTSTAKSTSTTPQVTTLGDQHMTTTTVADNSTTTVATDSTDPSSVTTVLPTNKP